MIEALFFAVVSAALVYLLCTGYFVILNLRYPEPNRTDEVYVVTTGDGWQLRLYRRRPTGGRGEPVFFMHSLSSNHLNFEIPAGYSLVDYLSSKGYDCWTFDSRACRTATPPPGTSRLSATLDDLLTYDIPAALECIREKTGHPRAHWIGHSMGGMLCYAYDLKFDGAGLASAVTLGSPPGFKGVKIVPHDTLVFLNRFLYGFLSGLFRGLAPFYDVWRPKSRLVPINWDNVHPKVRPGDIFHAAEMPKPRIGAQMDAWASRGQWVMYGGGLDVQENLDKLKTPLFAIFGGIDPFIPEARAISFFKSIRGEDKRMVVLSRANGHTANYSHIELAFAYNGEKEVFEPTWKWLKQHPIEGPDVARKPLRKAVAGGPRPSNSRRPVAGKPAVKRASSAKKKPAKGKGR